MPSIRILIADDCGDWRRQVRLLLQARPDWQVVCEALDGSEVVQKAEELRPDLIVLDVGLPNLNGIEAARRIRRLSPYARIIFLSQDNSLDVVHAALSTGALGYIHKMDVRSELLLGVDAILQGKPFVSSGIEGYKFKDIHRPKSSHHHDVLFYSDHAILLDGFTRFIATALKAGDVAVVVATESNRDRLARRLKAHGMDVDAATQRGTFVSLDVGKTIHRFMENDIPDSAAFFEFIGSLIEAAVKTAKKEHPRVVACGESAPLLWAEGKVDAAIQFEQLWAQVATIYEVDILCGYALSSFDGEEDAHVFQRICAEHSGVYLR